MRFPYQLFPVGKAIWPLGGRWVRPRPVLAVTIIGPNGTAVDRGLLDTGSDDTVFPDFVAATIGVNLAGASMGGAAGVARTFVPLRYADVTLRITDGRELREWPARVGFTAVPLRQPLLGFAGFLQFFTATFHGDREEVELTVNSLYQGT